MGGRGRREGKGREGREGKVGRGRGREGKGTSVAPPQPPKAGDATAVG